MKWGRVTASLSLLNMYVQPQWRQQGIGEVSGVMAQIEQGAINVAGTVSNLAIGS